MKRLVFLLMLLVAAGPVWAQRGRTATYAMSPASARVEAGGAEARLTLQGRGVSQLQSAQALLKGRPAADVTVKLGRTSPLSNQRSLTLAARSGAYAGTYEVAVRNEDPRMRPVVVGTLIVTSPAPPPALQRYWISNYWPNSGGQINNTGILDASVTGDANDGYVHLEGPNLAHGGVQLWVDAGGQTYPGQIIERTEGGSTDVITARFSQLRPGELVVRNGPHEDRLGPVARLAYRFYTAQDVSYGLFDDLTLTLGGPSGSAMAFSNQTYLLDVASYDQFGLNVNVANMNSQTVTLALIPGGSDAALLRVTIDFETAGPELVGTFTASVSAWQCGTFRVEQSACGTVNLGCFAQVLGSAWQSAGTCLNPANWSVGTVSAPPVPIQINLVSPRLTLDLRLKRMGNGTFIGDGTTAMFSATATTVAAGPVPPVDLSLVKDYFINQVNADVQTILSTVDAAQQLATPLNALLNLGNGWEARNIAVLNDRLFIDLIAE